MENQINVGEQNTQQIGQNPINQSVQIPDKQKVNYWMISTVSLCTVFILGGLLYLNLSRYVKNTNHQQSASTNDTIPTGSERTLSPTNIPLKESEIEDQKYGYLGDLSIKPDGWSYGWIVKNPSLSETEKNEIDNYLTNNLKNLFETDDNKSKYFINNFKAKSFMWRPVYNGTTSPPNRTDLKSIELVINYEFQLDWFKTTYFKFPDGNTGSISIELVFFDYKNNKFVKKEIILPSDTSKYLAFKHGVEKIISSNEAKKLIKSKMSEKERNIDDSSIDYTQYVTVVNNKIKLLVGSSNITKLCAGQEKDTNAISKVNATNCSVDLFSTETQCEVKETYCAGRL